jgi:histidine triad (HIT) family protein
MSSATQEKQSLFTLILDGLEPGKVIARDDDKKFAIIQDIHPEGAVHWLALPFEHYATTEAMIAQNPARFTELIAYAVAETGSRVADYPALAGGFTIKFHFGGYETMTHAKLHVVSVE